MILAFDTFYVDDNAKTICIGFEKWTDTAPCFVTSETLHGVAPYIPGEFYRRELPCIISLLEKINLPQIETIVIDGFVITDDTGKAGLGGHLYQHLQQKIPVIGVAKTNFLSNTLYKRELLRGKSKQPLYITAAGMNLDDAAENIRSMHGENRIPFLLKELDRLTREDPDAG